MKRALAALALLPLACSSPEPKGPLRVGIDLSSPARTLAEMGAVGSVAPGIETHGFVSRETLRAAFASGEVDAVIVSVADAVQLDVQIVFALAHSDGWDQIVARRGISRVEELEGARVALESETAAPLVLRRALEMHGVEPVSVEVVSLPTESLAESFEAGEIDAAACEMLTAGDLRHGSDRRVIFTTEQMPGEAALVLAVRSDQLPFRMEQLGGLADSWDQTAGVLTREVSGFRLITITENPLLFGRDGPLSHGLRSAIAGLSLESDARLSPVLLESLGHAVD